MTRSMLTSRRAFLTSAAVLPAALPCVVLAEPAQDNVRADLLALITEL
ncbi:MAG: twin-arginine translocation signal domain-containing protein [Rhodobacteraceae bacterium]|nr:twin-arginine translocation signal domain-containing protein [Paracoccaceae bacterium]